MGKVLPFRKKRPSSNQLRPEKEKYVRAFHSMMTVVGIEESLVLSALHLYVQQTPNDGGRLHWTLVRQHRLHKSYLPGFTRRRLRYRIDQLVKIGVVRRVYRPRWQGALMAVDHDYLDKLVELAGKKGQP